MSSNRKIDIPEDWLVRLRPQFDQEYMSSLRTFLMEKKLEKTEVYPTSENIFRAFHRTSWDQVKVIILGQDPYHGPGQAHGLSFSVPDGVRLPPSLLNIYKELCSDIGCKMPKSGNLTPWADQGVLLLNSVLTVTAGQAASHQGKGWEIFTDAVISLLNKKTSPLVFILWGSYALKKGALIDPERHLVLKSVHPSPLSAHRGFFGSRPFSKTNTYLESVGAKTIRWEAVCES